MMMTVCYNKLWKLLIDKNMKKKDLRLATGISTTALAKLGKNEHCYLTLWEKVRPLFVFVTFHQAIQQITLPRKLIHSM